MGKRAAAAVLVILAALASAGLKIRLDRIPRARVPGAGILYVPSGKYLKPAALGYDEVLADLVYIWAIQYYGNTAIPDRFEHLYHIFSVIAELDPRYVEPYEIGALIAWHDARDAALALRLFDLGFEKNPDMWIFPFEAGHYAQMYLRNFDLARDYYRKAMEVPGSPPIAKRLYANAAYKLSDYRTAWDTWREVFETSDDPEVRKIASNHLYNIKASVDLAAIDAAVAAFRARFGRLPGRLENLAAAGLLAAVPKDFDGKDYVYDSGTGKVKTAVVPWKR